MRIGDKVGFKVDYVNGGDQVIGTVEDFYGICGKKIVIVRDAKNDLYKVREEDIIVFSEEPVEEESSEEKGDPREDTITISRQDFVIACMDAINPKNFDTEPTTALAIGLSGIVITRKLEKALFDGGDRG